jgi:Zn finger protein HypA/HybF involved in hydrogenase expression
MIKYFLAAAATFLVAACIPSNNDDVAGKASTTVAPASRTIVKIRSPQSDTAEIPSEINIPSPVGEVIFHHQMHLKDLAIKCVECHHQIDAKQLSTPHPDYLKSSWINCKVCHDESGTIKQKVYTCSECHSTNPINIADETLSAKVVIHKQCWKCHQVSTGKEASKSCEQCHSGKKTL